MIFLVVFLWIFAVATFISLLLPADPDEVTSLVIANRLGKALRVAVFVLSALALTSAYL